MRGLHEYLLRPKTAAQLISEYGSGAELVKQMRALSDRGKPIKCALIWEDGFRLVYWAELGEDAYTRRRLAKRWGISPTDGEVV